jgi:hypothetical protein
MFASCHHHLLSCAIKLKINDHVVWNLFFTGSDQLTVINQLVLEMSRAVSFEPFPS